MPCPEDLQYLALAPEKVRAQAYDVVLNGTELGSGSIRIHDPAVQQAMLEALGFSQEQIEEKFGFLVEAFGYGAPPHGGFAFGLDRLAMLLLGAESLRDVTAFPKAKDASCPLTQAPDCVGWEQLEALGLGESFREQGKRAGQRGQKRVDVKKVARLSRLALSEEEEQAMGDELSSIIAFADQLAEVELENAPVMEQEAMLQNVLRRDEVQGSMERDALLENAPSKRDGYLLVPQIIE